MFSVLSALQTSAIYRLKQSHEKLSSKHKKSYEEMLELMESVKSFKRYRDAVAKAQLPCIPYLVELEKYLYFFFFIFFLF